MQVTVTSPSNNTLLEVPREKIVEKQCSHCNMVFKKAIKEKSSKEDVNQLRLAYTGKPQNETEVQMLKMVQDMIKRNW